MSNIYCVVFVWFDIERFFLLSIWLSLTDIEIPKYFPSFYALNLTNSLTLCCCWHWININSVPWQWICQVGIRRSEQAHNDWWSENLEFFRSSQVFLPWIIYKTTEKERNTIGSIDWQLDRFTSHPERQINKFLTLLFLGIRFGFMFHHQFSIFHTC